MTAKVSAAAATYSNALYRKITLRVVPLMALCFIVAYLDRVNISFAKLQMQQELNLSNTVYGIGASAFFVGYVLFEIPSNLVLNKVGARKWISRIMISWGIASALMMFVRSPWQLYIMRFLVGALEAGFIPGVLTYFTYWFPSLRRARAIAFFFFAICISGIGGGPLAGWILAHLTGVNGWAGWQWLFLAEGIPAVVLGLIVFMYFDDRPASARWLSDAEKAHVARDLAADAPAIDKRQSVLASLANPKLIFVTAIYFLGLLGFVVLIFWMPQLIKNSGVENPENVGELSAIPWLVSGVAMMLISISSDRSGERKWHMVFSTFVSGIGYIICAEFPFHPPIVIGGLSLAMLGYLGCNPILFSLPSLFLSGVALASGIALVNTIGNIASIFGPAFIGWLTDLTKSTHLSIEFIGLLVIFNGLLTATLWPFGRIPLPGTSSVGSPD